MSGLASLGEGHPHPAHRHAGEVCLAAGAVAGVPKRNALQKFYQLCAEIFS